MMVRGLQLHQVCQISKFTWDRASEGVVSQVSAD